MMMIKITSSFLFIFLIIINNYINELNGQVRRQQQQQQRSTSSSIKCNRTNFENDFDRLLVVDHPTRKFPQNQQELKKFCSESKELIIKLNQYKERCSKETLKNFVSIILYAFRGNIKRICSKRNSPQTLALIDASDCMNRNKPKIGKCMSAASLNYAAIKLLDTMKMPYLCCQFVELLKCFQNVMIKNNCEDKLPILLENIGGVVGNFMDATCGEYNLDTDKCEQLPSLQTKNLKPFSKNFITNLVDIFNSV